MRAGVGHGAVAEALEEGLQFRIGQGIVGLDRVAADGFGDHVFAEAHGVDAGTCGFEFIDQRQHEPF